MNWQTFIPLVIGFLSAFIAIIGYFLHRQTERIKIIENQLSEKKYRTYIQLVGFFYNILKDVKFSNKTNEKESVGMLIDIKKDLLIYGSDKIFQKYVEWLTYTVVYPGDNRHFKHFLELLLEIRKDMGNPKTKLTKKDVMLSLTQNPDTYEEVKCFVEW
jgi:hypothetical protein